MFTCLRQTNAFRLWDVCWPEAIRLQHARRAAETIWAKYAIFYLLPTRVCIYFLAQSLLEELCCSKKKAVHFIISVGVWVVHLSARSFVPESAERVTDVPVSPRGTKQHLVTTKRFLLLLNFKPLSSLDSSSLVHAVLTQLDNMSFQRTWNVFLACFYSASLFSRHYGRVFILLPSLQESIFIR